MIERGSATCFDPPVTAIAAPGFIIGTRLRAQFLTGTGMVAQNDAWKRAV
jgi:hypothetical protein